MKIFDKYILRMFGFLILILFFCIYSYNDILNFFSTNHVLNSLIIFIIAFGVIFLFRQVLILKPEIEWLNIFISKEKKSAKTPVLLKPMSELMKTQTGKLILSQVGAKTILESLESRLIEQREISRYLIGICIFLGLLGTFWGLLETIKSVSNTVTELDFSQESDKLFLLLKSSLQNPLSGMGTAFSSSLFGLSGSLILGFFDLQSNQAQNRFYNEVEEKLAIYTKISSADPEGFKTDFSPAYIESLIEITTENLKKSTSGIEKQNISQEKILNSLLEMNQFLNSNIEASKQIRDELKILSKTISNTLSKNK